MSNEKQKEGYAWHVYHDELLSWCFDYDIRVRYIKGHKPQGERKVRLERLRFVSGKLPVSLDGTKLINRALTHVSDDDKDAIIALHKKECFNCTWNGTELVFPSILGSVLSIPRRLLRHIVS